MQIEGRWDSDRLVFQVTKLNLFMHPMRGIILETKFIYFNWLSSLAGGSQSHQKDNQKDTKKTPKRHQKDNVSFWCLFGELNEKNTADLQHYFESYLKSNFETPPTRIP